HPDHNDEGQHGARGAVHRDATDAAGDEKTDPHGWQEEADPHRGHDHDGVVDGVDGELSRHGQEAREEYHDRGQALHHRAEEDEHDGGDEKEDEAAAGHHGHEPDEHGGQ